MATCSQFPLRFRTISGKALLAKEAFAVGGWTFSLHEQGLRDIMCLLQRLGNKEWGVPTLCCLRPDEVGVKRRIMTGRSPVEQKVFETAAPRIEAMGLELVDVEMVRENQSRILRIYIDKAGGVGVEDCSAVSQMIDPIIDSELNLHNHDFFEVSSPGLERILRTERDFERYQGDWVEVTLYKALDGQKKYQGKLAPCSPEAVGLVLEDGSVRQFSREQVARTRLVLKDN
jgi:ribosome maturation factor RimP